MAIVSIVVPCYNVALFIRDCVNSITNQSFKDWEIILVDDGSTDDTGDICDQLAILNSNIRVIHQENQGVSAARRAGLKQATGCWIMFVDGDDTLPKYALERMVVTCMETHVDVYVGGNYIQTDSRYIPDPIKVKRYGVYSKEDYIKLLADYRINGSLCLRLIKKEVLNKKDICIPRFIINNEDYLYNLFLSSYIKSVYISDELIYIYNHTLLCCSRGERATGRQYDWDYWKQYFVYLHNNYRKYNVSDDTYCHSILMKLSSLIRNSQDYKNINMNIPPFDIIGNIQSLRSFNFWQILIVIIYEHRSVAFLLMPMMRIHPKKFFRKYKNE